MEGMRGTEVGVSAEEALAYLRSIPPPGGKTMLGVPFEQLDVVRFGFVGLGGRGFCQFREMLGVAGAKVTAIYDPDERHIARAKSFALERGHSSPAVESDWRKLCERKDIDCVYICSPWDFHAPQALYAMQCGKHAAVEVPLATSINDCWRLVNTSERTRRHCVLLENDIFGETSLMVLNMVRAGLLGTITHGEAAYIHDLRQILMADEGEGLWRREPHQTRNGNLYPTHGLGPVARYMNINRGDRFTRLVSMSSQQASLSEYRDRTMTGDNCKRHEIYRCGDMNSSLLQTACGRSILLQHDVVTPRPYTRLNLIAGSKGTFADFPPRIFLDGQESHDWKSIDELKTQFEHPLWKEYGDHARKSDGSGHGGVDFIMNYQLVQAFRQGHPPEVDVYDGATWSAAGPLSDISVAWESLSVPFPDFTRGLSKT
jgi:hypothetical protein